MRLFLAGAFLLFSIASFGQAKRALSLIEKQKYETAFDLLSNGLEKDTLSASTPFVMATLYLTPNWPRYQLDSAYYFSLLSLKRYSLLDEKHLDKHIKDGFGKTRLLSLKKQIDSLAFEVAKTGGSQGDYQVFIDLHIDSNELDSAIYYRNEQAFSTASAVNTLASYKQFLDSYPLAADWAKANAKYQQILYTKSTISGKLKAYQSFVKNHTQSPYYEEAVHHIFIILAGQNTSKTLLQFVEKYPNSKTAQQAIGILYHTHIAEEPATSFADKYPIISIRDSLQLVINNQHKTRLPIWKNPCFQVINIGQQAIIDSLISIDGNTLDTDFLLVKTTKGTSLINKNGAVFYTGSGFTYIKKKDGFVFINEKEEVKVIHKTGLVINAGEEAYFVGPYISYKKKEKWGLKSITNLELLPTTYDSIWSEQALIFLSDKDKIKILKPGFLYPALDGNPINLPSGYDEYEWLTNQLLWVEKSGKEALFTSALEELVPSASHQIDLAEQGWSITTKKGITVADFSDASLETFEENNLWQIGTLKDSVVVKFRYNTLFTPTRAHLLGPSAISMHWADSAFVYISDSIKFYKPKTCEVKPLQTSTNAVFYYEVTEGKNKKLINNLGEALELPNFTKIIPLSESFFQLQTRKTKQLFSENGDLLLDDIDGAALINDSTLSILKDQKFGILQPYDTLANTENPIFIAPVFTHKLTPLNDSIWVAASGNELGLIHTKGDTLLAFNYKDISPWVNGLLFVKKDLKWNIFDLKTAKFLESGIVSYASITKVGSANITYQKGVGIGIFDSGKGVVLKPTYTDIALMGSLAQPYYRAEKYVEEAGLHIMLYYNLEGNLLFQNILNEAAFSTLFGSSD